MTVKPGLILVLLLAGISASAQRAPGSDTVLKGSTIEVIQSYKPRVKQSPKPEWKPQLPPVDTSKPSFNSDVPQQTLYYSYNSPPLRPLALGKAPTERPYPNYVKAGGGNLSTLYMDAGIGGIYSKDYETALHLHHISQKGSIANQQSSLSGLEADGTLHNASGDLHGAIAASHNRYRYYGYDHFLHNYDGDSVSQAYTLVKLSADLASPKDSNSSFEYHPGISATYYGARYNTYETTFGFDAPLTYHLNDNVGMHIGLAGALTNYKSDTITAANNFIQATPGLKIHVNDYSGHALLGLALGKDNKTYILPDLKLAFSMQDYLFNLSLGWKANLRQNTYEQLTGENPYMGSLYSIKQTKRDEVYVNVQGALGNSFSYTARGSWWNYSNLPTFLNDGGDQKTFQIVYQDVRALSFQISARYQVANKWSGGLTSELYSFLKSTDQFVWHVPTFKTKGDFTVNITPKFNVSVYALFLSGIHARDNVGNTTTLKTIADLGTGAEYSFIPRLSAFVQINNLLNSKYQRWQGYQVYGFNIYGGLRLKF
jgi:hypothetical protein